jgi:hypothetical protein
MGPLRDVLSPSHACPPMHARYGNACVNQKAGCRYRRFMADSSRRNRGGIPSAGYKLPTIVRTTMHVRIPHQPGAGLAPLTVGCLARMRKSRREARESLFERIVNDSNTGAGVRWSFKGR